MPVLELKISDGDWNDYHCSLEVVSGRQTADERMEFGKCLQDLRYLAMTGNGPSTTRDITIALREQIAGLSVRDVLVMGCSIKPDRKQEEEKGLLRSILLNRRLKTRAGDDESADFLATVRRDQAGQIETLQAEIAALRKRLDELMPSRSTPI